MKYFLSILLLISTISNSFSKDKLFLKCLGQEELKYHKQKAGGALLNLNKAMISEFIQMSDTLTLKEKFQNKICNSKSFAPSYMTLYVILQYQEAAFALKADPKDIVQNSKDKKTRNEVINRSFFAFTNFINDLQMRVSKPNCIIAQVPELKDFYNNTLYTLENIGIRRSISNIKNLKLVFEKLIDPRTSKSCL